MRKHGKRRAMRACLARVIRRNGPKIRIKRLQCRKLMDNDCFRSKSVCGSCWVLAATVADLSGGRMPFSCAIIKRKVAILSLSILPLDGRRRPSPQSWPLPISFLPHTWRPWRTLREPFFRPPSALARQDAAPPEVARKLLNEQRGDFGGAASRYAAGYEITENIGLFACFPRSRRLAGGTPAPRRAIRFPPAFHVREAVFMFFHVDHPPALQPPLCFLFVLLCKILPLQALRVSAPPREFFPHPVSLPLPLRPLREIFFRPPSARLPPRRGRMP